VLGSRLLRLRTGTSCGLDELPGRSGGEEGCGESR
jgi:hypothetical protein